MWIEYVTSGKLANVPTTKAKREIAAGLATRLDDSRVERLQASIVVHSTLKD
jgi:hypothetical protein